MELKLGKPKGTGSRSYEEWLGKAPEFDHIDVELEADVVVCGGGLSGVAATRAAVEQGASVIQFEKTEKLQSRFGDFGSIGSMVAERWGRKGKDLKQGIMKHFMKETSYWPRQRILKYWLDNSGPALDWYLEAKPDLYILARTTDPIPEGVKVWLQPARYPGPMEKYDPDSDNYPSYQITVQFRPTHETVLLANYRLACEKGNVHTLFKTPVRKLITGGNGRVIGVIAQGYDGKVYKAMAGRGVVLATGDYSGNLDILYYYCPWLRNNPNIYTAIDPEGYLADTGDGHRMGIWIGARMERGPHAPNVHNMGGPLGVAPYLQLDLNGERFMNEDVSGQQIENQLAVLPGNTSWQIFDSAWPDQLKHMSPGHGCVCMWIDDEDVTARRVNHTLAPNDGYTTPGTVEKAASGKYAGGDGGAGGAPTIKSDTIEGLVEKMGLPREKAIASIRRYNELTGKGNDEDFGKTASRMFPLENPPFYACKLTPAPLLVSMSGLESDHHSRCLNSEGYPIPGLYVCGNVQGGRFSIEYPITVPGMSHSMALTFGRLAGMNAAKGY
ncbi:MAG: FAD-binding protein [Deltaproteobacteria bacterium]|nr:FAD-binding protein [Deltaproteobacteria bacterium]